MIERIKLHRKIIFGVVLVLAHTSVVLLALSNSASRQVNGIGVVGTAFFVIGLAIFLLPAETLLRIDRQTGYYLYKMAPDQKAGLRRATVFYSIFGLIFMFLPTVVYVVLLLK